MAKIRNLKYGLPNNQIIVEQPVYNGINLTKWIHNGQVVWENGEGKKYTKILGNSSSGSAVVLDYADKDNILLYRIASTTNYVCNERIAIKVSNGYSTFNVSKDLINWTQLKVSQQYKSDTINSVIPTRYGFLYKKSLKEGSTSYGTEIWHCSINPNTLEIIKDIKLFEPGGEGWEYETSFGGTYFLGGNGRVVPSGGISLDGFWRDVCTSVKDKRDVAFFRYKISTDADGNEYVSGLTKVARVLVPDNTYSSYSYHLLADESYKQEHYRESAVIAKQRFYYGGIWYLTVDKLKLFALNSGKETILSTNITNQCCDEKNHQTYGEWLDARARSGGGTAEEIAKRRANIASNLESQYDVPNEGEAIITSSKLFDAPRGGDGEIFKNNGDLDYVQKGDIDGIRSGFLGRHKEKTDWVYTTNYLFPVYTYNSTQKKYIHSDRYVNVYNGTDEAKVSGYTNVTVAPKSTYAGVMSAGEDLDVSYENNLFYCMGYGVFAIFRHKKDIEKSFAVDTSSGSSPSGIPIDLPPEYFE